TDVNAHPHIGGRNEEVALVHNGVIENHSALRRGLEGLGYVFRGQTDSEVVAHLLAHELDRAGDDDLYGALQRVLPRLEGTYGLAAISPRCPGQIVGARLGSPLVVGVGEGEHFLASDPLAVAPYTARVAYLQDGEVVRLTPAGFEIRHREAGPITPRVDRIDWKPDAVELGGHAHYMLKEIREQPDTVLDASRGRLRRSDATAVFGGLNLSDRELRRVKRVVFAACGTSWHAALVGEYLIERLAHLPVEVEYAGEFRYRNAPIGDDTVVFVLSQSGETADTLGALRESKRRGHATLAIVNTVGSTIAREADGGIFLHAGPEVGVASTKAFTAQVTVLTLLALYLGRLRDLSFAEGTAVIDALERLPEAIGRALAAEPA
ncbi:MAG: isomerizing glutamine--fructose-6-phosphate transaminase, partial [Thermoleophilia bacterium]|nr:isomerizing glutamine--fructose-6-phosphate transaminase [Thermoleophilia bacterium]